MRQRPSCPLVLVPHALRRARPAGRRSRALGILSQMVRWSRRRLAISRSTPSSVTIHFLDVAIEIAQAAGKILREEFDRPPHIAYKGEADLVTQADKRSERCIVERLTKYFPEHAIVAEEGSGRESSSEFRWYVDPLDGTTNFAHGYPCFSVSMGLAQRDTLIAGVVYNPYYDELFAAARGQGATLNGQPIHVSKVDTLAASLLCTGFPAHKRIASPNIHYYWDF